MYFHSSQWAREKMFATLRSKRQGRYSSSTLAHRPLPDSTPTLSRPKSDDSGYASSASLPARSSALAASKPYASMPPNHSATERSKRSSLVTEYTETVKSTRTPKETRARHSRSCDAVYACPRPLTFPFHNDCHFLPVAEADPRDVARISPIPSKVSSLSNIHQAMGKDASSFRSSVYSSRSTTLSFSRSSDYGDVQSTKASIRSWFSFKKGHKSDSKKDVPPLPTTTTSPPLLRLANPKPTLQSIRNVFKRLPSPPKSIIPSISTPLKNAPPPMPPLSGHSDTPKKPSRFFSTLSWPSKLGRSRSPEMSVDDLPRPPTSKPDVSKKRGWLFGRNKAASGMVSTMDKGSVSKPPDRPAHGLSTQSIRVTPPTPPPISSTSSPAATPPTTRRWNSLRTLSRPLFSIRRKPVPDPGKKPTETTPRDKLQIDPLIESRPSMAKRLWTSVKSIFTGNKTSRVGVL